ncbi:MAG: hypothetical protein JNM74_03510, partial [Myxococcales bacterium]|nr:hypothetical protein [Myxococcales bacterium]
GEGEADTLSRVLSEPIPKLRTLVPTLPAGIEAVVAKALDRDPEKRYATAAEFASDLEKAARPVRAVGTPKDVAACLDALMGGELTEQRAAVRTWLAQSEPSKSSVTRKPSDSVVTRIEGRRADESGSSPSAVGPAISVPHAAASSTSLPLITAAQAGVIAAPTSVSAASLSGITEPDAPRRRRPVWPSMLVAGLVGGAVVALVLRFGGGGSPAGKSLEANTNAAPSVTPSAVSAPVVAPSAAPSAVPSGSASSVPAPSASAPPWAKWQSTKRPPQDKTKPQAHPTPGQVPDDISNNPYR